MNRGHCPESLKQLFLEVNCRLNIEMATMGFNRTSELQLCLRSNAETKDMKKMILLHQEHRPKDVSRCSLQRTYRKTCGPAFKELLGVENPYYFIISLIL